MSSFFTPGTTLSVRARRALFESGNASTTTNRRYSRPSDELNPDENIGTNSPEICSPSSVRRPLSFMSPNNIKSCLSVKTKSKENSCCTKRTELRLWSSHKKRSTESIANLKVEISELQRQVQILDGETGRKELLELVGEKEIENGAKCDTLMRLNEKLTEIQNGLLNIEDERERIFSKVKQLERERESILCDLAQREKEIQSLSKRCIMQADKTKNTTLLLSVNKQLSKQIIDLQDEIKRREVENPCVEALQRQHEEAIEEHRVLRKRLSNVSKDHEALTEKLRSCLDTCEQLTEEKRNWEKERRATIEKANVELESERMKHEQSLIGYKADMNTKNIQINELHESLAEKVKHILAMKDELLFIENKQVKAMQTVADTYNLKLTEASSIHTIQIQQLNTQCEDKLKKLELKISEKDTIISSLRIEVETCMEDLMSTASVLNEHKENSKLLEALTEDVETLEHERYSLKEIVHEKETNIAELSAEILKLEIEKELLEQDSQKLQDMRVKLAVAMQEKESLKTTFEIELRKTRLHGSELEKKIKLMNDRNTELIRQAHMEHNEELARMRLEIYNLENNVKQQERGRDEDVLLRENKILSLEAQLIEVELEKGTLKKRLEDDLIEVREASARYKQEMECLNNSNSKLISCMRSDSEELASSLRSKIFMLEEESKLQSRQYKEDLCTKDNTITSLRSQVVKLSDDIVHRNTIHNSETANLQRDIQKMKTSLAIKDDEIRELRVIEIQERDEAIDNLTCEINRLKKQNVVKEKKSLEMIACLENQVRQLETNNSNIKNENDENLRQKMMWGDKLQETISDIKRDLEFARITITDLERKLFESNDARSTLQKQVQKLTETNATCQAEIQEMNLKNKTIIIESEELRESLKFEIDRHEFGDIAQMKEKSDLLQNELIKAERMIVLQQDQMADLEAIVQDRTQTLSTIVELNKESESKLDASERRYNSLEEKASYLQVELMDCESKLSFLHSEMRKKEDEYLDSLHDEQNRREVIEADLEQALTKLENLTHDKKELIELKRENQELKDKVHRQETFLQRKLSKDKVLRDRNAGPASINQTPISSRLRVDRLLNPSKLQPPITKTTSKLSKARDDATQMTYSTVDETEYMDLELENLLAD